MIRRCEQSVDACTTRKTRKTAMTTKADCKEQSEIDMSLEETQLEPTHRWYYVAGSVYKKADRYADAVGMFSRALESASESDQKITALHARASIHAQLRNYQKAM